MEEVKTSEMGMEKSQQNNKRTADAMPKTKSANFTPRENRYALNVRNAFRAFSVTVVSITPPSPDRRRDRASYCSNSRTPSIAKARCKSYERRPR